METQTSGYNAVAFSALKYLPTTVSMNWYRSNESSNSSTLTYSVEVTGGNNSQSKINIGYYVSINGTTVYDTGSSGTTKVDTNNGIKKTGTISISHTDAKDFNILIYVVDKDGNIFQNNEKFTLPKLYPSSIATRLKVDVVGGASVNKLPYRTPTSYVYNGITWTANVDGSVTIDGTATDTSDFYLHGAWNHWQYKIHCEGEHYIHLTSKGDNPTRCIHMYIVDKGTNILANIYENQIYDMGTETDLTAVFLRVENGATVNNMTVYPMIANSNVPLDYVQYNEGTPVKGILGWTNYANMAIIHKNYKTNLYDYVDGTYKLLFQYERYYTTQKVREVRLLDVIPPEVELTDNSKLISCNTGSDNIEFEINLDVFAGTQISEVFYSMDYGKTWTSLPITSSISAHRTFVKRITLTWLDEIYLKLHGKNPVDEKEEIYIHEMPSDYKLWLNMSSLLSSRTKNLYDCGKSQKDLIDNSFYYNYDELTGIWTLHGIALKDITIKYKSREPVVITNENTDYTLSIQYLSGDVTTNSGSYSIKFKDGVGNITAPINQQTYLQRYHLSVPAIDGVYDQSKEFTQDQYITIKEGTEFNNFKFGIQLEAGLAITDFEPFGLVKGFTRRAFGNLKNNTDNKKIRHFYKK